jgi:hypothetical protein
MGLGWLAMLAFWGAVIVGIILLVRALVLPSSAGDKIFVASPAHRDGDHGVERGDSGLVAASTGACA